jgi:drug/metabolite transporter (DMT)-like permease
VKLNPRLELFLLGGLWGLSYVLIEVGLRDFSPAVVVFGRLLGGSLVLLVALIFSEKPFIKSGSRRKFWLLMPIQALVASALPYLAISYGETKTSTAIAGMLNAATPLFTVVFVKLTSSSEVVGRRKSVGVVLGLVGVALILSPWNSNGSSSAQLVGDLVVLLASISYALGFVYTKRYLGALSATPIMVAFAQISIAGAISILYLPFFHAPRHPSGSAVEGFLAIVVLGFVQTGLATLMYHRVVRELGATASSVVSYIVPLVAVAAGVVLLGDHLSGSFLAGAGVVLISVVMVAGGFKVKRDAATKLP